LRYKLMIVGGVANSLNSMAVSASGQIGCEVLVCPHRLKALALANRIEPDLIILGEESMADSLEICRRLRRVVRASVVVIGGVPQAEGWFRANDAGADVYLARPVRGDELLARIKSVLRRRRWAIEKNSLDYEGRYKLWT